MSKPRHTIPAVLAPEPARTIAYTQPAPVLAGMWWNNVRRAWFTGTPDAPVLVDPQPPAPVATRIPVTVTGVYQKDPSGVWTGPVPPAVKVEL